MSNPDTDPSQLQPVETPEDQPDLGTAATPPRENPETDEKAVEQEKEKLDKTLGW